MVVFMADLTLERVSTSDNGTIGKLFRDDVRIAYTCELPWKDNHNQVSCIPQGTYTVTKFTSPSKGRVFLVHDVPDRSMIEIHAGNTMEDVLGCICVGDALGSVHGLPAVLNSRLMLSKLLESLPDSFTMQVMGVI